MKGMPGAEALRHLREMSINRLVFGLLALLYFTAIRPLPHFRIFISAYVILDVLSYAWSRLRPGLLVKPILVGAMLADVGMISISLHLDGPEDAALFPLYLWVILGNGFRLGNRALFVASALSCAAFAAVIAWTPYWKAQPPLSISLLLALLALPAYSSTLISKLSRAREQAEEASRAKSMFLASISHELRTPLNAILGSVSLIEDTPLNDEQQSLFKATRSGTQALLSLIGGVLDFSRAEAGLMPVADELVDLAALLVEIRDLVAMQARLKSLRLSVHAAAGVPPLIMSSRKTLMEILLNLASNAIKFTESGAVCITVGLESSWQSPRSRHPGALRFEVSDTGIGIAADAQARIFDVFSQADASILDRFGGSGLGLALCRKLVTLLGGEIGVASRPAEGSTFWFTIRLAEAEPASVDSDERTVASRASAALLCDDPVLADAMGTALRVQNLPVRRVGELREIEDCARSEILFLYRRDAARDLAADCALLEQLDPFGAMPRVLIANPGAMSLADDLLRRHFITAVQLPASGETLRRACHWATAATNAAASNAARPEAVRPERTPQASRNAARLHILVADDNSINRQVLGKILERAGHRVTMVEDGAQALDAMEARHFDLVLMDVNMPAMNGLETTRLFRLGAAPDHHLPIVALTADATAQTQARCREAGMDGCITKPITASQLISTIDDLVQRDTSPDDDQGVAQITDHPRFARSAPALDANVVAELRSLGGEEFVGTLLRTFVTDSHAVLSRLEAAVIARDMASFRFELHALCSGAANIGARALLDASAARDISHASLPTAGHVLLHTLRHELACIERETASPRGRLPTGRRIEDS